MMAKIFSVEKIKEFSNDYFNTFSLKKDFWKTFAIDFLVLLIITGFFFGTFSYFNYHVYEFTGGRSPESLQIYVQNMSPEEMHIFFSAILEIMIFFFITLIFLLAGTLLLFSYSRHLVWKILIHKERRRYRQWNYLNLALIPNILLYLLIASLLMIVVSLIIGLVPSDYFNFITNGVFQAMFVIFFLFLLYLIYYNYALGNAIFQSITNAFNIIKMQYKKILKFTIMIYLTLLFFALINLPIVNFFNGEGYFYMTFSILISLFLLSWIRYNLVKIVKKINQN